VVRGSLNEKKMNISKVILKWKHYDSKLKKYYISYSKEEPIHLLKSSIKGIEIQKLAWSDHSLLLALIDLPEVKLLGGSYLWRFNNLLLGENDYCTEIHRICKSYGSERSLYPNKSAQDLWYRIKQKVKYCSKIYAQRASQLKKGKNELYGRLQHYGLRPSRYGEAPYLGHVKTQLFIN